MIQQALKTVHIAVQELCTLSSSSIIPSEVLADLASSVSRRLCDPRWEVRDSATEFVGTMAQGVIKGNSHFMLL